MVISIHMVIPSSLLLTMLSLVNTAKSHNIVQNMPHVWQMYSLKTTYTYIPIPFEALRGLLIFSLADLYESVGTRNNKALRLSLPSLSYSLKAEISHLFEGHFLGCVQEERNSM